MHRQLALLGTGIFLQVAMFAIAQAQVPDPKKILDLITDTADRICYVIADKGSATSTEAKGAVNVELSGLASRLLGAGVRGNGGITSEEYQSVLRSELATSIRDSAACKLRVFESLQPKLLVVAPVPAPQPETSTVVTNYVVCVGEYQNRCPPNSVYLYCGASVPDWAKNECRTFGVTRLNDVPGNKCGYYTAQVTCTRSVSR
jgi:hypothetical protein